MKDLNQEHLHVEAEAAVQSALQRSLCPPATAQEAQVRGRQVSVLCRSIKDRDRPRGSLGQSLMSLCQ
jgi:hypothetical protein